MTYRDDAVVWDDYVQHRQFGLPDNAERVLRFFRIWRDADEISAQGRDFRAPDSLVELLKSAGILIERGSPEEKSERVVREAWEPWSQLTTAFHLSSTFLARDTFLTQEQSDQMLRDKVDSAPPPAVHYTHPRTLDTVSLEGAPVTLKTRGALSALMRERRSIREFGGDPVSFGAISHLLTELAVPNWYSEKSQTALKEVPSGGGRHPTELYLYARDVEGLNTGVYHLNTALTCLEKLSGPVGDTLLMSACGEQLWTAKAQVLLFYTSRIKRNQWKYSHSRSYRVLHYDVGHFAQAVALTVVDMGLVSTFTAALRDDLTKQILMVEEEAELVMGCTVIGTPAASQDVRR